MATEKHTQESRQRVRLLISGRVQGVCFRMCARDEAMRLGLTGWVRNRHDGSVEAEAEGVSQNLVKFIKWCRIGPRYAHVDNVREESIALSDSTSNDFLITG